MGIDRHEWERRNYKPGLKQRFEPELGPELGTVLRELDGDQPPVASDAPFTSADNSPQPAKRPSRSPSGK
jgi:hypothetical protein